MDRLPQECEICGRRAQIGGTRCLACEAQHRRSVEELALRDEVIAFGESMRGMYDPRALGRVGARLAVIGARMRHLSLEYEAQVAQSDEDLLANADPRPVLSPQPPAKVLRLRKE